MKYCHLLLSMFLVFTGAIMIHKLLFAQSATCYLHFAIDNAAISYIVVSSQDLGPETKFLPLKRVGGKHVQYAGPGADVTGQNLFFYVTDNPDAKTEDQLYRKIGYLTLKTCDGLSGPQQVTLSQLLNKKLDSTKFDYSITHEK